MRVPQCNIKRLKELILLFPAATEVGEGEDSRYGEGDSCHESHS